AAGEDFRNPDQDVVLPVAALAPRILAPPLLEGDDLRTAAVLDDLGRNARARNGRLADFRLVAAQHDDFADLHNRARLAFHALNLEELVFDDTVLLAAGFDDCEHRSLSRAHTQL